MCRVCVKDMLRGIFGSMAGLLFAGAVAHAQITAPPPSVPELVPKPSSEIVSAEPGWVIGEFQPVSPEEAYQILGTGPSKTNSAVPQSRSRAAYATPESYQELAQALENDPLRIYQYVRNHFEYVPYFGFLKGPYLTLHERSGNDFDQAALLIELLRAAGITARFQFGKAYIDASNVTEMKAVADWLGTDQDTQIFKNTFANGSIPVNVSGSIVEFSRVWVEAIIDQQSVLLDPAFKPSIAYGAIDLGAAMNYTESGVLGAGGGIATANSIKNMDADALASYLEQRATDLQGYLQANHPNAHVEEVLGGYKIVPDTGDSLPTALPLKVTGAVYSWDAVPENYTHKVHIKHGGIDISKDIPDIAGRKLSLIYQEEDFVVPPPASDAADFGQLSLGSVGNNYTWRHTNETGAAVYMTSTLAGPGASAFEFTEGKGTQVVANGDDFSVTVQFSGVGQTVGRKNVLLLQEYFYQGRQIGSNLYGLTGVVTPERVAQFYLDDELLADEGVPAGDRNNLRLEVDHPYVGEIEKTMDQERDFAVERTGSYVIVSAFGGDRHSTLLSERQRLLNRMSLDGTPEDAPERLTETLNVIGQTWMQQTQLNADMQFTMSGRRAIRHHRFGVAGQEDGYSIDMAAQGMTITDRVLTGKDGAFKAQTFVGSALEHSVLDQLQGVYVDGELSNPAASTIRLMAVANSNGDRLFVANNSNFSSIEAMLRNYSTEQMKALREGLYFSHMFVLPEDAEIQIKEWSGLGYIEYSQQNNTGAMGMLISGGLNGGKGTIPGRASPVSTQKEFVPEIIPPKAVRKTTAGDPVDLGTGAFISSITDLSVAGGGTRGLDFTRSYSSHQASEDSAGLGRGWTHNYNIYLSEHSDVEAALGERTVFDAIPMIVVNEIASSLLQADYPTPNRWGAAILVANWGMDQLLNKSVTVHMGSDGLTFQEMPNGDFMPPPGVTTNLSRMDNGNYELRERFGTVWRFNADDRINNIRDVDGQIMSFTYYGNGRLAQVEDAHSRALNLWYSNDALTWVFDSAGRTITYGQSSGDLTSVAGLESSNWTYEYDSLHRLEVVINPDDARIVDNTYNDFDRVVSQIAPRDTGPEVYKMHYGGVLSSEEDPQGFRKTYHFDLDGRRVATENALGHISRMEYDGQGHLVKQIDPLGNTSTFVYDGDHNLKEQMDSRGKKTRYTYDGRHRLKETRNPLNHVARLYYNTKNHITKRSDHYGNSVENSYLASGLVDSVTDPRSTTTSYSYDEFGYLDSAQTGSHPVVDWTYNARGDMESVIDQEGAMTLFDHDTRGLVEVRTDARAQKSRFEYTAGGQLKKSTDRNQAVTQFSYTDSGKPNTITYADSIVDFNYDANDNMVEMVDSTGTTSNTYDVADRLASHTDSNGHTVGYDYDAAGNLVTLTYPPGNRQVNYTYDNLNRLSTVSIGWLPGKPTMRYIYDDASRLDRVEHFNAMETDYSWDNASRLTGIAHQGAASLVEYSFMLDANGNRTQETISPAPLMPAGEISDDTSYDYNLQRNRLQSTSEHTYTYGGQGQLTATLDTVASRYHYDNEGQLAGKGGVVYTFDDAHRLTRRGNETYAYDGVGNRLSAVRAGVETQYVYDAAGNMLAQANSSGGITRYYIHGAGLTAMVQGGTYYVYHFDGTGHTVALTNASNTVVNKYAYSPYGKVVGQQQAINQPFKYAGQVGIVTESDNVYYMRARYYDAETGRFISEDPAGFIDGTNLYAYVGGNPVNAVDPSGRFLTTATGFVSGAVGGALGALAQGAPVLDVVIAGFAGGVAGGVVGTFAPHLAAVAGRGAGAAVTGLLAAGANTGAQVFQISVNPNLQANDFSVGSAIASGYIAGGAAVGFSGQLAQNAANVAGNTAFSAAQESIFNGFLQPQGRAPTGGACP